MKYQHLCVKVTAHSEEVKAYNKQVPSYNEKLSAFNVIHQHVMIIDKIPYNKEVYYILYYSIRM